MDIARIFANAIVRRVAYVLVALVFAWLGLGQAHASSNHATRVEAFNHAKSELPAESWCASAYGSIGGVFAYREVRYNGAIPAHYSYYQCRRSGAFGTSLIGSPTQGGNHTWVTSERCDLPLEADQATGECRDPAARCLAKNADRPGSTTEIYTGQKCIDGCMYGARSGKTGTASNGATAIIYGEVGFTGETCPANSLPTPPQDPETCTTQAGNLLTMCVKDDGRHCYAASTGKQICWGPGETGTKTDGNVAQKRTPGTNPQTPPTPPEGDTFVDSGKPTTTTTTTPGGTVINNTTNNYTTGSGNDAGDTNDGETPGDDGEDDEEPGSASGGEGCDLPPTCSGGDAVGCAALVQIWRVRCSEGRNKITGGAECDANGNAIFVCAGDQIMCREGLFAAEAYCAARKADGNGDGQPDWTDIEDGITGNEGAGDDPGEGVGKVQTASFGAPMLDETGLAWSRSCPTLGTLNFGPFGTFDLDAQPWMCDFTQLVRMAFFLIGSFLALTIILGWRD